VTSEDVFRRVVSALDAAGVPFMLTGSFASSYHGVLRATRDIDFVIEVDAKRVRALIRSLPNDFYVDEDAALQALRDETQFNAIDPVTGWKIDFIIRKSRPFSREEFSRRQTADLDGISLAVATAEDVIVAKLEWARLGGSLRQIEDVAGIVRVRRTDLDAAYIERWVSTLGLTAEWTAALATAAHHR
jgi:hypothetical protein